MQRAFAFRREREPRSKLKAHARSFIRFLVKDCRRAKEAHARSPSPQTEAVLKAAKRMVRFAFKARH